MGSIFVISDLHLGASYSYHTEVAEFINWLVNLEHTPEEKLPTITHNSQTITLEPPEKLILLGDILEIWEPLNNEFNFSSQGVPF